MYNEKCKKCCWNSKEGTFLKTYPQGPRKIYLQRGFFDFTFFPLYGTDTRPQILYLTNH